MKLRNKKTGKIYGKFNIHVSPWKIGTRGWTTLDYTSVDKFNEEWEDYEPKEPLIDDGEARHIMRLWAKRCAAEDDGCHMDEIVLDDDLVFKAYNGIGLRVISLGDRFKCTPHEPYTIDELCGKEE